MSSATALAWFARHEIRLAWREWLATMTGGRRKRTRAVIGLFVFAAIMHVPAYAVIGRFADLRAPLDKSSLIVMTATLFLAWALMLSQAIESVTRVFYARADLDLIMSSPVRLENVFSIRIASIALSVIAMALLFSTPFVDVLVIGGGIRWLAGFGVVVAIGLSAAAMAIAVTIVLFRLIGPSRTRLVAQILAAIIGAGFVIALQIAAILSSGTLSRFAVLTSDAAARFAPDADSIVWWPARAVLGDGEALLLLLAGGLMLLGAVMATFAGKFADTAVRASASARPNQQGSRARSFRAGSRQQALRRKEFVLLRRDPWLVSQTLMQLLYLVPPAVMLWRSFNDSSLAIVLITPVIVMAAGQLAGGLAWLTISGEDAADLVATAPLTPARVIRAKDRGGADRDRRHLRAAGRSIAFRLAAAGGGHRGRRHRGGGFRHRHSALVPGAGQAQPVPPPPDLVTAGNLRGSVFLDRMGRKPHWRWQSRSPHSSAA
jgi:ABC-2 type transport system permease protein